MPSIESSTGLFLSCRVSECVCVCVYMCVYVYVCVCIYVCKNIFLNAIIRLRPSLEYSMDEE